MNHLKNYFLGNMPSYIDDLIPNQIKQTWIRIAVCILGFIYLTIHSNDLVAHDTFLIILGVSYLGLQIHTLVNVKKNPLSFPRMMIAPIFDAIFLSVAILVDGGQFSPLYLAYLAAIMGTGMRFGNRALMYTQVLSVIAFPTTCFYLFLVHHVPIDIPTLIIQIMVLIMLPRYTQLANTHADHAVSEKNHAESIAFQLLDKSPIAAFTFQYNEHKEICINYVNQSLQDISPLPIEELIGYPIRSLFSTKDIQEVEHACEDILIDETKQPSFYIRTQGKKTTLQLFGHIRCLNVHQTRIGICFLTDITQQQQDTLKMQKNMHEGYMSTLVAGMVHDFRNVLTSIMGMAEMMQFSQKDEKVIRDLELIIQASEQGSRMVNHLLSLGKASQLESNDEKHDVMQALRSIVNLLRIQLPESIPLTLDMPKELSAVNIRLTQLEQILMNLIKNAAEASPEGGAIDVRISTGLQKRPNEKDKPAMMIQVTDHGIGIAEENLHKVSKAFWTSRKDSGGTGLGLAMVQRIVRQHNGSFHIDSTLGQGTTITLTFPIMDQQPSTTMIKKQETPILSNDTGTKSHQAWNILLVDDNHDVIQVHQHMLERMGHQVSLAHDGKEALTCLQKDTAHFHCIITDFIMPHMDGIDLCQHIRQQHPTIPLLMITAFGENDKLQQCHELDVHMVSKPISFQGLKQTIDMIQIQ